MPLIEVVAAVISGPRGVLLTRRLPEAHLGGMWEFPGGKRRPTETPEQALRRELLEELGVQAVIGPCIHTACHDYPDWGLIEVSFFATRIICGVPRPLQSSALRWFPFEALPAREMPIADQVLLRVLAGLSSSDCLWTQ